MFKNLKDRITDIKERRHCAKCGYRMQDVWNIDSWFLEIMPHILNDLLEGGMGYPGTEEIDTFEKWQDILKRMKYCFEEALEDTCSQQNEWEDTFDIDLHFSPIREDGLGEITTSISNEENYEKYKERELSLYNYREQMKKEALELFVKYFNNLWD